MEDQELITRSQYMANSSELHNAYWRQFVTPAMIKFVVASIGEDRLRKTRDYHLNDIPLPLWDTTPVRQFVNSEKWKDASLTTYDEETQRRRPFLWSISDNTCLAKHAAHIWLEEQGIVLTKDMSKYGTPYR